MATIIRPKPREEAIIALDISSVAVGVAAYYKKQVIPVCFTAEGDYLRIIKIAEMVEKFCYDVRRIFEYSGSWDVWVEQPFYSSRGGYDTPIKMAHGAVMLAMWKVFHARMSWNAVGVSTWRSPLLPKKPPKKLTKDDKKIIVMKAMAKRFNIKVKDDNIGDALGILDWRLKKLGG